MLRGGKKPGKGKAAIAPVRRGGRLGSKPAAAGADFAGKVLDILEATHPDARCALEYRNPFELAVATILSAQCTDERVNKVTPILFDRFPTPAALAEAAPAEVEDVIRSTGFFRAKARSIRGFAEGLLRDHAGAVPSSLDALVRLPGIGRKTASVVLGHAFDLAEGIAVDTHVLRVSNRLGMAKGDDPLKVEAQLMSSIPRGRWTRTTDLLIFHGRRICDARRPRCGACPLFSMCRWPARKTWAREGREAGARETPRAPPRLESRKSGKPARRSP